jgi:penicillin G amidase
MAFLLRPLRFARLIGTVLLLAFASDYRHIVAAELAVPGLNQPVEILHDRWGIAHLYARNEHDLFFAQGFNVARDRLFQLEMWRREATGTLAEILGPKALQHDRGARLLRFRGDMSRELLHYHPRGDQIIAAFVEGINAYIALTEREPARLPFEFRVLGTKPGRWTPEVVVSRHNGLFRNVIQEVQNARLVRILGSDKARELLNLHPGKPSLDPGPVLNLAIIQERLLELYRSAHTPVRFLPEDVLPEYRNKERKSASRDRDSLPAPRTEDFDPIDSSALGSNNWVISGDHTFSGAPIMANDPHRVIQIPSLRYWVHLVAPGWDVIGGGEPALPGVSIGHNTRGAWGLTIFAIDQEDLYVYETDPANALRYRYQDAWEPMKVVRESIPVHGQAAEAIDLKFTRHGPIIHEDHAAHRAYALRAAWLEEGTAPYLASLRIDQVGSWQEFREACRDFRTPSENLVWADVDGHIGWQAVGLAPIRRNWSGLLPVPGDGRYEWEGFVPPLDLPHRTDPLKGWVATANQDNLPRGYPFAVGFEWTSPFRFARIEEVLASGRRFTMMDMMRLQQDELSIPARSLVPLLLQLGSLAGKAKEASDRLKAWNFVLDKESVPAAIYVTWEQALRSRAWELLVPREAQAVFPASGLSIEMLIPLLMVPDGRFGPDPIGSRDALLARVLDQAVVELERRLGPGMEHWKYGQIGLKHIRLVHPLSDAVRPDLRAKLDLGPLPRGGYAHTVNSTSDSLNQSTGASFRLIADTGNWDRSVGTNSPGQSGDPASPHYSDLFELWARGQYVPVFSSRGKVESVTESRTVLKPVPASVP